MPTRKLKSLNPSFISLFSGCGGLDLGFHQAGLTNLGAYDADQEALAVHAHNLQGPTYRCDLSRGVLPVELEIGPDIVLAGSPCQGFSTIGKRVLEDARNDLLVCAGKIAIALKPKVFVAENVPAAAYGQHARYWQQLNANLMEAGYKCRTVTLNAGDFGVPQMRQRLFLIASLQHEFPEISPAPGIRRTVSQSLLGLETNTANHDPIPLEIDGPHYRIALRIQPGQKLCDVRVSPRSVHTWHIPEVFGHTSKLERVILVLLARLRRRERVRSFGDADPVDISSLKREFGFDPATQLDALLRKNYIRLKGGKIDLRHTFNGKFRRLDPNGLSPTVDTTFGAARNFLHPTEHRAVTVREAARVQGFPDTFEFSGHRAQQFKFIGNAVPPPVGLALAERISLFVRGQRVAA